jgi:hypothetical protein
LISIVDKEGLIWNFFVDNKNNLCYTYNNDSSVLLNNCTSEFDCSISSNGEIHITIQNTYGEIVYINFNGKVWKKYIVLQNKSNRQSIFNITLFIVNGIPTVFYCIFHNHRFYIVYQSINIEENTNPKVIDYSFDGDFSVSYDNKNHIHLTYKNEDENHIYKVINLQYSKEKSVYLNLPSNVKKFASLYYNNCLNIVHILRFSSHYTVNYKNITANFEHTLGFGNDSLCIPIIFPDKNKINVIWKERFLSYLVTSENNGKTFSKIELLGNKELIKCKNNESTYSKYIIKSTY